MKQNIGYNKSINKLQGYGLSFVSASDIMECVAAYQKYETLPQATKDSIQVIADMYTVTFTFTLLKRNKLALTGIHNQNRSTYLYTDETLKDRDQKKHWRKKPINYFLKPFADNKFEKEE